MQKLTIEQAAVIGAYTGILCGNFGDLHEYIEKIMGRTVYTHELGSDKIAKEIKYKSQKDFISIYCQDKHEVKS